MTIFFDQLRELAQRCPGNLAVESFQKKQVQRLSYFELVEIVEQLKKQIQHSALRPGDRAAVFVPMGFRFLPLVYALLECRIIPVFIDPGMGMGNLRSCLKQAQCQALIADPRFLIIAKLFVKQIRQIPKTLVFYGGFWSIKKKPRFTAEDLAEQRDRNIAAIVFTSGGTGPPKGVVYTLALLQQQQNILQKTYDIREGQKECATFPLFSLLTLPLGVTQMIGPFHFAALSRTNFTKVAYALLEGRPDLVTGSQMVWRRMAEQGERSGNKFFSVKLVLLFGAPLFRKNFALLRSAYPHAEIYSPYGATESLPVAHMELAQLEKLYDQSLQAKGICLGKLFPGVEVKIADDKEICVSSQTTMAGYFGEKPREAASYHAMGDLGYWDDEENLWMIGRKAHCLYKDQNLLAPLPYEEVAQNVDGVFGCRLGHCRQRCRFSGEKLFSFKKNRPSWYCFFRVRGIGAVKLTKSN